MGVVQRLNQFIEKKGISKYKFYQKTGLSNGALDKGENLGSDKCEKIYYAFPVINILWLLTGLGEMLINEKSDVVTPQPADKSVEAVVYYNMYKEKEAKVEAQAELIGELKQTIRQLEEQVLGLQNIRSDTAQPSAGSARTRKSGVAGSEGVQFAEQSGFVGVK